MLCATCVRYLRRMGHVRLPDVGDTSTYEYLRMAPVGTHTDCSATAGVSAEVIVNEAMRAEGVQWSTVDEFVVRDFRTFVETLAHRERQPEGRHRQRPNYASMHTGRTSTGTIGSGDSGYPGIGAQHVVVCAVKTTHSSRRCQRRADVDHPLYGRPRLLHGSAHDDLVEERKAPRPCTKRSCGERHQRYNAFVGGRLRRHIRRALFQ